MSGQGKKEAHKDCPVLDQIDTLRCTSWKKEDEEKAHVETKCSTCKEFLRGYTMKSKNT